METKESIKIIGNLRYADMRVKTDEGELFGCTWSLEGSQDMVATRKRNALGEMHKLMDKRNACKPLKS